MDEKREKKMIRTWIKGLTGQLLCAVLAISILSLILGMYMLVMTVVPSDPALIRPLLEDITLIILNSVPILCIMLLLFFVINRVWISFLLAGILFGVIATVNRFKLDFRDDPFVFSDILLAKEATEMTGRYELYVDKAMALCIAIIAALTVLCAVFLKIRLNKKLVRGAGGVITVLVMVLLCRFVYFEYGDLYDNTWHWQFGNQWKTANQYMSRGVVYSFIQSIPEAIDLPPEGYDEDELEAKLDEYEDVDIPEEKKVNIISIMLEAYNDFSVFDTIEFKEDPYENFHALQSQSYYGNLYTNIFAGGTVTTERAFLTGYCDPELRTTDTESYVRYFNSQGYYTEAMHPCYGWFYDRQNINEFLGFQNFDHYGNAYSDFTQDMTEHELYDSFLDDYDFFDYIIEGFEEATGAGQKYFNFSVTYQNHGPYSTEAQSDTEFVAWQDGYTEEEYNIINNYLYWIDKTDDAIAHLYEYFSQSDEPVVLILFGDHNPWLGDSNSVYYMLDFNFDMSTPEGGENYYQTPYVIYANDAAKAALGRDFVGQGDTVSPMFLMNELFDYVDLDGPKYLNYLSDVKEKYDVINTVYVGKGGEYELRENVEDDGTLLEVEQMCYYMKRKAVTETG
ncbi:LTA synthase family protein [Ruminococcus sp. CLA-AA-H200]|uniref:LTA synthase family protein n=1 Tax=Ruminococcus turbiniformis TaxID=2881258 RepID=A0ABS8FZM0_9FIRM|nr:LTA synthase family protein [Ruminococcus turbiniformis]MCC2254129.1 LTA synthase family protein [Ruminococcus turbiniformis]